MRRLLLGLAVIVEQTVVRPVLGHRVGRLGDELGRQADRPPVILVPVRRGAGADVAYGALPRLSQPGLAEALRIVERAERGLLAEPLGVEPLQAVEDPFLGSVEILEHLDAVLPEQYVHVCKCRR